jgi:nucleolar GTP-binding protein
MSAKLTAAGYDPSNVEERARVIAKARGLIGDGNKRSAEEMEVDDGEGEEGEDWADEDSMEVDAKRSKTSVTSKGKLPRTDRQTAGLGSAQVRFDIQIWFRLLHC